MNEAINATSHAEKFKNQYRIPSARLSSWDYRWAGAYFITICTPDKKHYFGEIIDNGMQLSHVGVIADVFWHEIKKHETAIELGEFVVMPNHIHGILIIPGNADTVETLHATSVPQLHATSVPQPHATQLTQQQFMASISPKPDSISTIVRSYKSAVTKHTHRMGYEFAWQPRFYDHIIRNEADYERIATYVIHNPESWAKDKFWGEHE